MSIATIFAHLSCSDIELSTSWYEKLFGQPPIRRPMPGLVEWQFSDSAEVQLYEQKEHAGHSTLTLGVLPMEPERTRLVEAGLAAGPIEQADDYFIMQLRDPDQNLVVLASILRIFRRGGFLAQDQRYERARSFLEDAPTSAAAAVTIILDGVKADRWRILVGNDAHRLDERVRQTPEQAYDVDFYQSFATEVGWRLG